MKIPTQPTGAPYYHGPPVNGMDMNQQWQGNGVVIDGGVAGNGAAYILPHPMHPAGFVPPGGYYAPGASPPAPPGAGSSQDFSEYMWMENEEEFDKQVMQQLEEEALMEQCIEAMLADEREAQNRVMELSLEEQVSKSTLNPEAAEFIPTFSGAPVVIPSTSDQDVQQPSLQTTSTLPKSVESSMSELSVSQVSDAPTDSSKSSTAEIAEVVEECSLPLDSAEKTENPEKVSPDENVTIVNVKTEDAVSRSEETQTIKEEPAVEEPVTIKESKPETKSEAQTKKVDKPNLNKGSGASKARPESKSKEAEIKPPEPEPEPTPLAEAPQSIPEVQKPVIPVVSAVQPLPPPEPAVPAAPVVFNYAAAARANLPPKPAPVAAPAAATVLPKQDSVSKESSPLPTPQTTANAAPARSQTKPLSGAKPMKAGGGGGKDVKDSKTTSQQNFSRAGGKKNNKK